ncbi:MAG TPA: hypothetical protein VKR82_02020 [Candidatus Acidoferrales bacterium]|nr:hypothetical protein [Candidatus Acidoferrales bacterium]
MDPHFYLTHERLLESYEIEGQFEEARQVGILNYPEFGKMKPRPDKNGYWRGVLEVARQKTETRGETYIDRILHAIAWAQLGEHEKSISWLEKSAENEDDLLPSWIHSPILDPLHGDPRYNALVRKLNLAP